MVEESFSPMNIIKEMCLYFTLKATGATALVVESQEVCPKLAPRTIHFTDHTSKPIGDRI